MTPHASGLASSLACFGRVQIHRDAAVFVGSDGDGFDARCPQFQLGVIQVAGPVIWMHTRRKEDLGAQVVSKPGETALVKHQGCRLLPVHALGFEMRKKVVYGDGFVQYIGSEASQKRMPVFFRCWEKNDIGCRPEANGVLVGDEHRSQTSV